MKVNEAIAAISQDNSKWARPLWWRNSGLAISIYNYTRLAVVPSSTGGQRWNVNALDLMDDWEVVEPDVVLDER